MTAKRKSAISVLFAIVILSATLFCMIFCNTAVAECSEDDARIEEVNVAQATALSNEDFSVYTNKELPDKIDKNNISEYVPIDKFNKDGTTIYNGRNYGFVIYSSAKTNHVLLFKEIYTNVGGGEYTVEFKVIYANSFFKTGNSILNANSPYSLALSNVNISQFVLNADMQYNMTNIAFDDSNSQGPYFYKAGLSGDISFLDKDSTSNGVAVSQFEMDKIADNETYSVHNASDLTINAVNSKNYLTSSNLGSIATIPNYTVRPQKSIDLSMNAGADDFLAYKNGKQDYLKASFTLSQFNDRDYYIYNNISFNICTYNAIQVRKLDRVAAESVYAPSSYSTVEYGLLDRKIGGGYTLKEYQRFAPMLDGATAFEFVPDKARNYKITMPEGFYSSINDTESNSQNVFNLTNQSNAVGFTAQVSGKSNTIRHGERLVAQDFIDGNISFANIAIEREQELKIGETRLNSEIPTYRKMKSSEVNNDLLALNVTGYRGIINLHILDEEMNILNSSVRYASEIIVNYPMQADKKYYIVCDNEEYISQTLNFADKGELYLSASEYQNIENLYYKYDAPKYTQYYKTFAKRIFDAQAFEIDIDDGDAFLEEDKSYYLQSDTSRLLTNISDSYIRKVENLGEIFECSQNYNEVFEFLPKISAQYKFVGGTFDVYRNWTLIAQDVDELYINESEVAYQFVKRQKGGEFELDLQGEELRLGYNEIILMSDFGKNQFVLNFSQKMRIEYFILPQTDVRVYDSQLNLLEFDHGYPLLKGKNYIIIDGVGECNINIEEYLQKIDLQLYVDGENYEFNKDVYYGKDFILPVPSKERYNFVGWKNGDVLVTDANGQSIRELLEESVVLTAGWQVRGAEIKTNVNGKTYYWDGQNMVDSQTFVFIDGNEQEIKEAVIAVFENTPKCNLEGHYAINYSLSLKSYNDTTDYYELITTWSKERYKVKFVILNNTYTMSDYVEYGATVTTSKFPQAVFTAPNWSYSISGWTADGSDKKISIVLNGKVEDYTPEVGSKSNPLGYTEVTLTARIDYVIYKLCIKSKYYEVARDGYRIESLEEYGYDRNQYIGKNVWFTDNKNTIYYVWDKVFPEDFSNFWKSGMSNVIIYMNLNYENINVKLKYRAYSDNYKVEKFWINDNPDYYCGYDFTLKEPTIKGWKFDNWIFRNKAVTKVDYVTLGFTTYTSAPNDLGYEFEFTTVVFADRKGYLDNTKAYIESSIGVVRINSYGVTHNNIEFIISPSVKEITFIDGTWNNSTIRIESRSSLCTINFDNVKMKAPNNQCVLYSEDLILIESFNMAILEAGDVTSKDAKPAVMTRGGIMFFGEEFIIKGGSAIESGLNGTEGIRGIYLINNTNFYDGTLTSSAKKLEVRGGNGAQGIKGSAGEQGAMQKQQKGGMGGNGGTGGNGACAINIANICISNIGFYKDCVMVAYGGCGGTGGTGGTGGQGSVGRDGKFGVSTINPGDGGDGGNGGAGGNGSIGIISKYEPFVTKSGDDSKIESHGGNGGQGGSSGEAGKAGPTAYTMYGNPRDGIDGEKGAAGEAGISSSDDRIWTKD